MPKNQITNNQHNDEKPDLLETNNSFIKNIISKNVISTCNPNDPNLDMDKLKLESKEALAALGVEDATQAMLASQMIAIHTLQQEYMVMAKVATHLDTMRYCTNTAIKLSNTFVQQANLLTKLQGRSNQKMEVEHVHVHEGGQAIVGNIQGVRPIDEKKK